MKGSVRHKAAIQGPVFENKAQDSKPSRHSGARQTRAARRSSLQCVQGQVSSVDPKDLNCVLKSRPMHSFGCTSDNDKVELKIKRRSSQYLTNIRDRTKFSAPFSIAFV